VLSPTRPPHPASGKYATSRPGTEGTVNRWTRAAPGGRAGGREAIAFRQAQRTSATLAVGCRSDVEVCRAAVRFPTAAGFDSQVGGVLAGFGFSTVMALVRLKLALVPASATRDPRVREPARILLSAFMAVLITSQWLRSPCRRDSARCDASLELVVGSAGTSHIRDHARARRGARRRERQRSQPCNQLRPDRSHAGRPFLVSA